MLFNSPGFIFIFLPATVAAFFLLGRLGSIRPALAALTAASLLFYAWWNPAYLALLLGSVLFNFALGRALAGRARDGGPRRGLLAAGIAANLGALAYFKYAGFLLESVNALAGTGFAAGSIVLPLAISFFTFQQITFLVDAHAGTASEPSLLRYCLFVTFFPQLIAGPIVHHGEMLPQFASPAVGRVRGENLARGATFFAVGLFKKVAVADAVAPFANAAFAQAAAGRDLTFLESWCGLLAYAFQLYFDFSGYSDMAVGLAALFGIRLPFNFDSPYKATSILEFWRRWHITLSRFLRDYLYIPLGGNRRGTARSDLNAMATFVLGGLWHGAGWTFLAWGALHGFYVLANRLWRRLLAAAGRGARPPSRLGALAGRTVTFAAVVIAWVPFRAESFAAAWRMLGAMAGREGLGTSLPAFRRAGLLASDHGYPLLVALATLWAAVWLLPNTQEFVDRRRVALDAAGDAWAPSRATALVVGTMIFFVLAALVREVPSEFLYFQF